MCRSVAALVVAAVSAACGAPSEAPAGEASFASLARASLSRIDGTVDLPGLGASVEVLRDQWGVPHIYAQTADDLFFAQGFVVAQDRLWHMEMSRRISQGRVAEIVGAAGVPHDRLTRTLKFRGPFDDREWTNYHPEARRIFAAYARGVNAYIAQAGGNLPVEFRLTGITPAPWAPEEFLQRARVNAAVASARSELRLAQQVAEYGAKEANRRAAPDPWGDLRVPDGLDVKSITNDVLAALDGNLYGDFPKVELLPVYRDWSGSGPTSGEGAIERSPGSNNWAVRGSLTATGRALMVDDPHRQVTLPAWRYLVHLSAPGWDVIGATEPGLPGVIRGHNGRVAWGRTATGTDEADVFVEELNPANPNETKWNGQWRPLQTVTETIVVKGEAPRTIEVKIGPHGPIFHEDRARHKAYAIKSSLQEQGTAEYLGGLRLDQATSARDCLTFSTNLKSPPTNLVCADVDGNIAFRVSAAAARRRGWDGRLPVPGTGQYEWDGLRDDLPEEYNPARGWIATANNNIHPPGFRNPLFFNGRPPYRRFERIAALLEQGKADKKFTVEDFRIMLRDSYQTEAAALQPWLRGWTGGTPASERARALLADWDAVMRKDSAAAALYQTWRGEVDLAVLRAADARSRWPVIDETLTKAIARLESAQGTDWSQWRWGRIHRSLFTHPLVAAYDLPAMERDGGAETVNATGSVYRLITDFADLDRSMVTIAPGQSGQPESPFYGNLLESWNRGEFFPLAYTRQAVDGVTKYRLVLRPVS